MKISPMLAAAAAAAFNNPKYRDFVNESAKEQAAHEKRMSFLMNYYQCDDSAIGEMCSSLDISLQALYEFTLAGYEYGKGKLTPSKPINLDLLGLDLSKD